MVVVRDPSGGNKANPNPGLLEKGNTYKVKDKGQKITRVILRCVQI